LPRPASTQGPSVAGGSHPGEHWGRSASPGRQGRKPACGCCPGTGRLQRLALRVACRASKTAQKRACSPKSRRRACRPADGRAPHRVPSRHGRSVPYGRAVLVPPRSACRSFDLSPRIDAAQSTLPLRPDAARFVALAARAPASPPPPHGARRRQPPSVAVAAAPPTCRSDSGGRPLLFRRRTTGLTCRCLSRAVRHRSCVAFRSRRALPTLPLLLPGPGNSRRPHGSAIPGKTRPSVLEACRCLGTEASAAPVLRRHPARRRHSRPA